MFVNKTSCLLLAAYLGLAAADCNPGACAGTLAGALGATGGAVAACGIPGVNLAVCVPAVFGAEAAWATAGSICGQCTKVNECAADDAQAWNEACGQPDAAKAELGPGKCMQLSSSVLNPSVTDKVVEGGFTYHCANNAVIVGKTGSTCFVPCTKCDRCAGVPNHAKRAELDAPSINGRSVEAKAFQA
ncbi:MAG: hypothetical protein M4579_006452 [Chaenotheca gracillima]|nr:MAG: hypothetical protein M4579_006452 [Chaenotheca gracillima]